MPDDVSIKIGIVGDFSTDNVKHISKRSGSVSPLHVY